MSKQPWWRGAVIYQIYPRSFQDTNGDGVGDLPGIIERLDYVASLGVDAIWVSPFFKSPMADFGYDIADYRDVDPLFGTLADFDRLIAKAHALGLKVVIDQVLSHTSIEHAWFRESRESRTNAKADWYVWADAREDGTPPNNWLSIFGGVAWQVGAAPSPVFPAQLPGLAARPQFPQSRGSPGRARQREVLARSRRRRLPPRCDQFLLPRSAPARQPAEARSQAQSAAASVRTIPTPSSTTTTTTRSRRTSVSSASCARLLDRYPDVAALGEISSEDSLATMAEYTGGDRLHMGYSFELLTDEFSTRHIRDTVQSLESQMTEGWPCWAISNHDVERVASRWGGADAPSHLASLLSAMVCSLRGSVCVLPGRGTRPDRGRTAL